jgi:hypothetical protein
MSLFEEFVQGRFDNGDDDSAFRKALRRADIFFENDPTYHLFAWIVKRKEFDPKQIVENAIIQSGELTDSDSNSRSEGFSEIVSDLLTEKVESILANTAGISRECGWPIGSIDVHAAPFESLTEPLLTDGLQQMDCSAVAEALMTFVDAEAVAKELLKRFDAATLIEKHAELNPPRPTLQDMFRRIENRVSEPLAASSPPDAPTID